jgi:hypothetical protein
MVVSMTSTRLSAAALSAVVLCSAALNSFAEPRPNPYAGIVDRNPFGLKPPPPPPVETVEEPAAPPPNVKLTGISNLFEKRALLEITELQAPVRPGQPPPPGGTVNRPIMAEGEAMFGVEVVAIDLDRNIVRIRNGGTESDLTFEVPKTSAPGAPAPPPVGRTASVAPPAPAMQPTIVSSSESRGGVTMLGGSSGFAGNTSAASTYGASSSGVSSYGATPMTAGMDNGLRNIPSRQMRTSTVPAPQTVDPDVQQVLMEANRMNYDKFNQSQRGGSGRRPIQYPPMPPTDLTPQPQGQPPSPGGFPPAPGH